MERILLIEDDQALGRGTALALAGEGREIRVAATLAQGWAALSEGEYALVLLDLNLPDGNGLDFLTALRRTSGVPVLILTANDLESDQVAGLELGADDYVTKPFSPGGAAGPGEPPAAAGERPGGRAGAGALLLRL